MDDSTKNPKIIISAFGTKDIDSVGVFQTAGQKENEQIRIDLANKCADFLQLQNLPVQFKDYCVKMSDIPDMQTSQEYISSDTKTSMQERTLLGMGLVYNHGQYASFIDRDGHTYLMPSNKVLLNELEKCGYVIAEYGEGKVYDAADKNEGVYRKVDESVRGKITLPDSLAEAVVKWDRSTINPNIVPKFNRDSYLDPTSVNYNSRLREWPWKRGGDSEEELSYDVFSLYSAPDDPVRYHSARQYLGEENLIAQKMYAISQIKPEIYGVNTFEEFVNNTNNQIIIHNSQGMQM